MDESIFKAYDIRGIYPTNINEDIAYRIAQGYASFVKPTKPILVGRDVRLHSHDLQKAVIQGLVDAGVDVVDVGLISTEMCYFGVGNYSYGGGIQVTASHNPAEWHGFKFVVENVVPLTGTYGGTEIKEFVKSEKKIVSEKKGTVTTKDILDDFCNYALTWVNSKIFNKISLVYNPNFGFEGKVLERLVEIGKLPVELIPLNAQPDGNFPKGRPDPFVPENRTEFVALVKEKNADLGVSWDADADRVFFCADGGTFLEPYFTNTLLIKNLLKKNPGEKILYDPRYAWALIDTAKEAGGQSFLDRVGYVYIKTRMRQDNMIFSGESSGHTYFRDFWYSDTGIIPLLLVWETISAEKRKLSELMAPVLAKYFISGEINFKTEYKDQIIAKLELDYSDAQINKVDGITIEYSDWRANVRGSNTEPLLRLNIEAKTQELVDQKKQELSSYITDFMPEATS